MKNPSGYPYQLEKISYLYPAYALEVEKENNFDFIETEPEIDIIKMNKLFSVLDEGINQKMSIDSLMEITRELDRRYGINNYEWVRLQLKILELALNSIILLMNGNCIINLRWCYGFLIKKMRCHLLCISRYQVKSITTLVRVEIKKINELY